MTPPFELTVYWCVEGLQCLVTPLRERVVRGSTALEKSLDRFLQWNHIQFTSISLKFNFVSQLTLINQFLNYQKLNKLNRGKSRLTSSLPLLEGFALFVCVVDAGGAFCWGCPFKVGNSVVTPPWLL